MQNVTDYLELNGFTKIGAAYMKGDHAIVIEQGNLQCYRRDGDSFLRYLTFQTRDLNESDVVFFFHAIGIVPLKTVVHKVRGLKDIKDIKAFSHLN